MTHSRASSPPITPVWTGEAYFSATRFVTSTPGTSRPSGSAIAVGITEVSTSPSVPGSSAR
jgi:hypothetical protein